MKTAADRFAFLEYQGPDDTRATKLNVSIFDPEALLILRTWQVAEGDIRQDPRVMAEVSQHLTELQVASKSTLEGIRGCPHEAGEDYPLGRNCPHCPYWANRDVKTGRLIEPKPPVMSLAKVLEALSNVPGAQPLDAIDSADAWREPLTESLLAAMERCLIQPALISNGQAIQGSFACYLLAKWREPRAFHQILCWLHLPDVDTWGITREIRDVDGDRLLASVYDGDFEALREAILNSEARAEARAAVLGAVGTLGLWGEVPLERVDAFLLWLAREGLERKPGLVWDELTKQCLSLGAVAVYDEVRRAVAEGLVTPVESLPELLETIEKTPRAKLLKLERSQKPPITDVAEETSWWDCWNLEETPPDEFYEMDPGEPAIPMVREVPKVGRNDPCPCGSGKKHKKCCGN